METEMQWLQRPLLVLVEVLVLFWLRDWNESHDCWENLFSDLITLVELGTYIKGHHVYKEIFNPELGEKRAYRAKQLFLEVCGLCWKRKKFYRIFEERGVGKIYKNNYFIMTITRAVLLCNNVIAWTAMQFEGWRTVKSPLQFTFNKRKELLRVDCTSYLT